MNMKAVRDYAACEVLNLTLHASRHESSEP